MIVTVHLACSGCEATAEGTGPLRKRFHGSHGDWGWGSYRVEDVEALAPEGWVMFDPYSATTYCPECWSSITADSPEQVPA